MFLKLCKHEIKYTYKNFMILYVLLLLAAYSITSILVNQGSSPYVLQWLIMYPVMVIITLLGSEILVIRACYVSMYSKTGYLTHTLPVSTTTLFLAKLCVYTFWFLLSFVAIVASLAFILSAMPTFHTIHITSAIVFKILFAISMQLLLSVTIILFAFSFAHSKYIRNARLYIALIILFIIDFLVEVIGSHLPNASYLNASLPTELFDMPIFNQWTTFAGILITFAGTLLLSMATIYLMKHKMELE